MMQITLNKAKIENRLFTLIIISTAISLVTNIWGYVDIAGNVHLISLAIMALLVLLKLREKNDKEILAVWIILLFLSSVSAMFGEDSMSGFAYMKKWMFFASTMNLYYWVYSTDVSFKTIHQALRCGILLAVVFIVAYFAGRGYANKDLSDYLTFNFSNPNFTGICLLNVFFVCIYCY